MMHPLFWIIVGVVSNMVLATCIYAAVDADDARLRKWVGREEMPYTSLGDAWFHMLVMWPLVMNLWPVVLYFWFRNRADDPRTPSP